MYTAVLNAIMRAACKIPDGNTEESADVLMVDVCKEIGWTLGP